MRREQTRENNRSFTDNLKGSVPLIIKHISHIIGISPNYRFTKSEGREVDSFEEVLV
jgi:hypothetical protein